MALISEILIEVNHGDQDFFFDPEFKIFTKENRPANIPLAVLSLDADSPVYNKQWRRGVYNVCESKSTFTDMFDHVKSFDDLKTIVL